jgi:hypothetical protein
MKAVHTTGLGEPKIEGKRNLFQPSHRGKGSMTNDQNKQFNGEKRIRTSIKLTASAIETIQEIQIEHRLTTGKVLPLWQLVCQAIEVYGKSRIKKENEE